MSTKEMKRRPAPKQTKRRPDPQQAKRSVAAKSRQRKATPKKKNKKPLDSEIVYTQVKPFIISAFLIHLVAVVTVVAALILGMSIFFKVGEVNVAGCDKYTAWDIKEASDIQDGDNLLTLNKSRVVGKIKTSLPYVNEVRIGIKLPKTVNIEITELDVAYAIADDTGAWWLMDSQGKMLESLQPMEEKTYTQVLGITVTAPQAGQQAVATEPEPATETATDESGATVDVTVPVTVQGREKLDAALMVLQYLEDSGVLGGMASVNVTDISNMEMWLSDRYQILLGDTTQLNRKVKSVTLAIDQLSDYQTGVLDASFTIWPDQVGYTAFEEE